MRAAEQAKRAALPPWNEGPAKQAVIAFVAEITTQGSADFIPRRSGSQSSITTAPCGASNPCTCKWRSCSTALKSLRQRIPNGRTSSPSRRCSTATSNLWRRKVRRAWFNWSCHSHRDVLERVQSHRQRLDGKGVIRSSSVYRNGLSADPRSARLPAHQRT